MFRFFFLRLKVMFRMWFQILLVFLCLGLSASGAQAANPADYDQGVVLYGQKQYAQAIALFQRAVQESPNDYKAYYYLGAAQLQMGDVKDGAVALGLCNRLQPNPAVASYVRQLEARLSDGDRQWVDSQVAGGSGEQEASSNLMFGLRPEPIFSAVNLADFNADAQTNQKNVLQNQQYYPDETFQGSVPTNYFGGGLEPVLRLDSHVEIGVPVAMLPLGTVSEATQSNSGGFSDSTSYQINAYSIGLNGRFFLGLGKGIQLFVGGGPLLMPVNIGYNNSFSQTISGVVTIGGTGTGNFSSTAFGGQVQLGLDYHLSANFVLSPVAGYQFASASNFNGTLTTNTNVSGSASGSTPTSNSGQLEVTSTPNGNSIYFLQKGSQPAAPADRPLVTDLSGPYAGIQLSGFF